MTPPAWKRDPRPNSEIVLSLEQALEAAKRGHVRSLVLVTVNPLHEYESVACGDLAGASKTVLIGALSLASHKLIRPE